MYDEKRELIASYRAMPETLAALCQDLGADAGPKPGQGNGWSVAEVVCHLLDAEQRTYERVIRIRNEEHPSLPLYPDDVYRNRVLDGALMAFSRLRREHARLLEELAPVVGSRTGVHEREGELSILDMTRHTVAHDTEHLAQIAREIRPTSR